ncbi:hypothetical protein PIB30_041720 [Stylosanthes scabra]|uniref:Di19 zinc-binding domain-containing protein n=1 Tax=Stylosanthes scabra TaxID=79078 RepID=A0ABU6XD44_9FABA|nr:hypothetical protein [Stylosanthes scabra]
MNNLSENIAQEAFSGRKTIFLSCKIASGVRNATKWSSHTACKKEISNEQWHFICEHQKNELLSLRVELKTSRLLNGVFSSGLCNLEASIFNLQPPTLIFPNLCGRDLSDSTHLTAMDAESSWTARLSSASKRYHAALHSRSDMFLGFDENDVDDDIREEFLCPFCSEYFDIVGLCCHIDEEHPVETKNGVCPVCTLRVGVDMVAHITLQHGSILKISFSLVINIYLSLFFK